MGSRAPGNLSHLQRLANAAASRQGVAVGRYQRWVSVQIISAVLGRVRDDDGLPLFAMKGGAAMELRLGLTARASKDYDATFRAPLDEMLDRLDRALTHDWHGFQFQRTLPVPLADTPAVRMTIKLAYKGRPWGSMQLDVAPAEGSIGRELDYVTPRLLDDLHLESPEPIPCVSIRHQIAQKIHASTEVFAPGRDNDRFRDLIDIHLLRDLLGEDRLLELREACVELFDSRAKHDWPPQVTVWPSWPPGFSAMARALGFYTADVEVAAQDLRSFIAEIDRSRSE